MAISFNKRERRKILKDIILRNDFSTVYKIFCIEVLFNSKKEVIK